MAKEAGRTGVDSASASDVRQMSCRSRCVVFWPMLAGLTTCMVEKHTHRVGEERILSQTSVCEVK
jgi:hypothetical protein